MPTPASFPAERPFRAIVRTGFHWLDRHSRALFGDRWGFEYALGAFILAYTVIFALYTYDTYLSLRTGFFDFGQVIQFVYLASQGHFTSFVTGRPIYFLFGGAFAIAPSPATLCVLQSLLLAIGAVPVYLMARELLGAKEYALSFAALYLLFPALWGANAYMFHDLTTSIPFFLFAVYFYERRSVAGFAVASSLAIACNEFCLVIAAFMAVGILIDWSLGRSREKLRFTAAAAVLVVLWAGYLQFGSVALANYSLATTSGTAYTLAGSGSFIGVSALLGNPLGNLGYAFPSKIEFLVFLLAPLLFLPLLSPRRLLPALPWLAITLLYNPAVGAGGVGEVYFIFAQWSSFLIPFLFVAALPGFRKIVSQPVDRAPRRRAALHALTLMFVVTLGISLAVGTFSPFAESQVLSVGDNTVPLDVSPGATTHGVWPEPVAYLPAVISTAAEIPQNFSVLTQNDVGSILWHRSAPVVIFYQPSYKNVQEDAILVDADLPGVCSTCMQQILSSGNYTLYTSYSTPDLSLYFLTSMLPYVAIRS